MDTQAISQLYLQFINQLNTANNTQSPATVQNLEAFLAQLDQNESSATQSILDQIELSQISTYLDQLKTQPLNAATGLSVDSYYYEALDDEILQGNALAFGFSDIAGTSVSVNQFVDPTDPMILAYVKVLKENGYLKQSMTFDEKVTSIYNHVIQNFDYVRDQNKDDWNFVFETITSGKGDCEDLSVLLMSLIYAVGMEEGKTSGELNQKIQGVAGSLVGFDEHVFVEYQAEDGQIYVLDPSLRSQGQIQNINQFQKIETQTQVFETYFKFNNDQTRVYGKNVNAFDNNAVPSRTIVSGHTQIRSDIQNLNSINYFLETDTANQKLLKLYNWFVSQYQLIPEETISSPPQWPALEIKAGNANDLTFLFANYLIELEKQSGASDLEINNKYKLISGPDTQGKNIFLLTAALEDGSQKIFDFSQKIYPHEPENISDIEFLPTFDFLSAFKILYSTEQLANLGQGAQQLSSSYSLSILDPALQTKKTKSFSASFGLSAYTNVFGPNRNSFLVQSDQNNLDSSLESLATWDPKFHPMKNNNISEPRIVQNGPSYATSTGWQMAAPNFIDRQVSSDELQTQLNLEKQNIGSSYYNAASVFQNEVRAELSNLTNWDDFIQFNAPYGYLTVDSSKYEASRENIRKKLNVYQSLVSLSQAMNASHGIVVETLNNGLSAYKQMDVKNISSQEANMIMRGTSDMFSDLNNTVNTRNQMLEAAFSKWINARQDFVNNISIGEFLGIIGTPLAIGLVALGVAIAGSATVIGLVVAAVAALAIPFVGVAISAGLMTAAGIAAVASAGATIVPLIAAGTVGAAVPAGYIAPGKYAAWIIGATAGGLALGSAIAIPLLVAGMYTGTAALFTLSFLGAIMSITMSALQLSIEAVKLETAEKQKDFDKNIADVKFAQAVDGQENLTVSRQNKPQINGSALFNIYDDAYDAVPPAGAIGSDIANGYKQSNANKYLNALEQIDRKQNLLKAYIKLTQEKHATRSLVVQELRGVSSLSANQAISAMADQEFGMLKEHVQKAYQLEQQYVASHNKYVKADYAHTKISNAFYAKLFGYTTGVALWGVPVVGGPGLLMAVAGAAADIANYSLNDENIPSDNIVIDDYGTQAAVVGTNQVNLIPTSTKTINFPLLGALQVTDNVLNGQLVVKETDKIDNSVANAQGYWMVDYDGFKRRRKLLQNANNIIRAYIMVKTHASESRNVVHQEFTQNSGRRYGSGLMEIYDREKAYVEQALNAKLDITRTQVQTHNAENAETNSYYKSLLQKVPFAGASLMFLYETDNNSTDYNIKLPSNFTGGSQDDFGGNVDSGIASGGYQNLDMDLTFGINTDYDSLLQYANGSKTYSFNGTTTVTPNSQALAELLSEINQHVLVMNAYGAVFQSAAEARRLIHQELTGIGSADTSQLAKSSLSADARRLNQDFMNVVNQTSELANLISRHAQARQEYSKNLIKTVVDLTAGVFAVVTLNFSLPYSVAGFLNAIVDFVYAAIDVGRDADWENRINRNNRINRFTAKTGNASTGNNKVDNQRKIDDNTRSQLEKMVDSQDEGDVAVAQAELQKLNKIKEQFAKLQQSQNASRATVSAALGRASVQGSSAYGDSVAQGSSFADNLSTIRQNDLMARNSYNANKGSKALQFATTLFGAIGASISIAQQAAAGNLTFSSDGISKLANGKFGDWASQLGRSIGFDKNETKNLQAAAKSTPTDNPAPTDVGTVQAPQASADVSGQGDFSKKYQAAQNTAAIDAAKGQANVRSVINILGAGNVNRGVYVLQTLGVLLNIFAGRFQPTDITNDVGENQFSVVPLSTSAANDLSLRNQKIAADNALRNKQGFEQAKSDFAAGRSTTLSPSQQAAIFGDFFNNQSPESKQNQVDAFFGKGNVKVEGDKFSLNSKSGSKSGTDIRNYLEVARIVNSALQNLTQLFISQNDKKNAKDDEEEKRKSIGRIIAALLQQKSNGSITQQNILEVAASLMVQQEEYFQKTSRYAEAAMNILIQNFNVRSDARADEKGRITLSFGATEAGGLLSLTTQGISGISKFFKPSADTIVREATQEEIEQKARTHLGVMSEAEISKIKDGELKEKALQARKAVDDYVDGKMSKTDFEQAMSKYMSSPLANAVKDVDQMVGPYNQKKTTDAQLELRVKETEAIAKKLVESAAAEPPKRQMGAMPDTAVGASPAAGMPVHRQTEPNTAQRTADVKNAQKAGRAAMPAPTTPAARTSSTGQTEAARSDASTAQTKLKEFSELVEIRRSNDVGKMREKLGIAKLSDAQIQKHKDFVDSSLETMRQRQEVLFNLQKTLEREVADRNMHYLTDISETAKSASVYYTLKEDHQNITTNDELRSRLETMIRKESAFQAMSLREQDEKIYSEITNRLGKLQAVLMGHTEGMKPDEVAQLKKTADTLITETERVLKDDNRLAAVDSFGETKLAQTNKKRTEDLRAQTKEINNLRSQILEMRNAMSADSLELMKSVSILKSQGIDITENLQQDQLVNRFTNWNFNQVAQSGRANLLALAATNIAGVRPGVDLRTHADTLALKISGKVKLERGETIPDLKQKLVFATLAQSFNDIKTLVPGVVVTERSTGDFNGQSNLSQNISDVTSHNLDMLGRFYTAQENAGQVQKFQSQNRLAGASIHKPLENLRADLMSLGNMSLNKTAQTQVSALLNLTNGQPLSATEDAALKEMKAPNGLSGATVLQKFRAVSEANFESSINIQNLGLSKAQTDKLLTIQSDTSVPHQKRLEQLRDTLKGFYAATMMQMIDAQTVGGIEMKPIIPISWGQDTQSATRETNLRRLCDQLLMKKAEGEKNFSMNQAEAVQKSQELFEAIEAGQTDKALQLIGNRSELKNAVIDLSNKFAKLKELAKAKQEHEALTDVRLTGMDKKTTNYQRTVAIENAQIELNTADAELTRAVRSYTLNFENDRTTAAKDLYEPAKKAYDEQMSKIDDLKTKIKDNQEAIKKLEDEKKLITTEKPGLKTISKAAQDEREKKIDKLKIENNQMTLQLGSMLSLKVDTARQDYALTDRKVDDDQKTGDGQKYDRILKEFATATNHYFQVTDNDPTRMEHRFYSDMGALTVGTQNTVDMTAFKHELEEKKQTLIKDLSAQTTILVADAFKLDMKPNEKAQMFETMVLQTARDLNEKNNIGPEFKRLPIGWVDVAKALGSPSNNGMSYIQRAAIENAVETGILGKGTDKRPGVNDPRGLATLNSIGSITSFLIDKNAAGELKAPASDPNQAETTAAAQKTFNEAIVLTRKNTIEVGNKLKVDFNQTPGKSSEVFKRNADFNAFNAATKELLKYNEENLGFKFSTNMTLDADKQTDIVYRDGATVDISSRSNIGGNRALLNRNTDKIKSGEDRAAVLMKANTVDQANATAFMGAVTLADNDVEIKGDIPDARYEGDQVVLTKDSRTKIAEDAKKLKAKINAAGKRPPFNVIYSTGVANGSDETPERRIGQRYLSLNRGIVQGLYLFDEKTTQNDIGKYIDKLPRVTAKTNWPKTTDQLIDRAKELKLTISYVDHKGNPFKDAKGLDIPPDSAAAKEKFDALMNTQGPNSGTFPAIKITNKYGQSITVTGKGQDDNETRVGKLLEKNPQIKEWIKEGGVSEAEITKAAAIIHAEDTRTIDDSNRSNYLLTKNSNGTISVQIIEDPEKIVTPGSNQVFLKFANSHEYSMRQASTENKLADKADLDHETVMTVLQRQEQSKAGTKTVNTGTAKPNS